MVLNCRVTTILTLMLILVQTVNTAPFRRFEACQATGEEICVEIHKCPRFAQLLNNTNRPLSRHIIQEILQHQCGFDQNTPKVCCIQQTNPQSTENKSKEEDIFVLDSPLEETKDNQPSDVSKNPNLHLLPQGNECIRIQQDFRIFRGSKTTMAELPWMALIAYQTDKTLNFQCAGSLINERYVLTAAHCLMRIQRNKMSTVFGVRLGENNINSERDCDDSTGRCAPEVQDFFIENYIVHPKYEASTFQNDIALIRLAKPANITTSVHPVCMPLGKLADETLDAKFGIVSGWGITETGYRSADLLKVSLPILSNQNCRNISKKYETVTQKQFCAGGTNGQDSCKGDSGGPLIVENNINGNVQYVQHGIVSYGPKHCGIKGQPGIYTRTIYYMDWILNNLKP